MTSAHLSVRVDTRTLERLDKESRYHGISRSELAKTLIEEGLRMGAFPGIIFKPGPAGRRPAVVLGPDVWQVVSVFKDFKGSGSDPIAATAEWMALERFQVENALAYYSAFEQEINDWIRSNDEEAIEAETAWLRQQQILAR